MKKIAAFAAPPVAAAVREQFAPNQPTNAEDRQRFLVWLRGPFKQKQPEQYEKLWGRMRGNKLTINALTAAHVVLLNDDPRNAAEWFAQLAESDQEEFDEFLEAVRPRTPVDRMGNGPQVAGRVLGRAFRQLRGHAPRQPRQGQ